MPEMRSKYFPVDVPGNTVPAAVQKVRMAEVVLSGSGPEGCKEDCNLEGNGISVHQVRLICRAVQLIHNGPEKAAGPDV